MNSEQIQGSWQCLTGMLAGNELPAEIVASTVLTIGKDTYEVDLAGTLDCGSCCIMDDVEPIKMKIDGNNGPNEGKTFLAILEFLNAEQIQIAYDLSGTEYPKSFEPTPDPSNYVATFKKTETH